MVGYDAEPFGHDGLRRKEVVVEIVATFFGRGARNGIVPIENKLRHFDESPAIVGQTMIAEENSTTAGATAHRSKVDDFVSELAIFAEENGAKVFDGVKAGHDGGRVEFAVGFHETEVERSDCANAEAIDARNVETGSEFFVVDLETGDRVVRHEITLLNYKGFIARVEQLFIYYYIFANCQEYDTVMLDVIERNRL